MKKTELKLLLIFAITVLRSFSIPAQPNILWQKCLGGNSAEPNGASYQTSDGGLILVGGTFSMNNGDVVGGYGGGDFWIVKTDSLANIEWQRALGGSSTEIAYAVIQDIDGGYLVAGNTYSNDGAVTGYHGAQDIWVIKLDQLGEVIWKRTLGGSLKDGVQAVCLADNGGFLVAGKTESMDGDALSQGHGENSEVWIIKLSSFGSIIWEKKYGGSGGEEAYSITQATDGGYVFAGLTNSNNGDVYGNHGNVDYWVVKLDNEGNLIWQKPLGGIGADDARDIKTTDDGGYIVVGTAGSYNSGQVSGGYGAFDFWAVKLNQLGDLQWQKAFGGSNVDVAISVCQTANSEFLFAGRTQSLDGDVQGSLDYVAGWVVCLDQTGQIKWQDAIGGADIDKFYSVHPTNDGGCILAGETKSNDGDISGNHGNSDFWVVKLSPKSTPTTSPSTQPLTLSPNPAQNTLSIQTQEAGKTDIQIYNLLGEVLQQQRLEMSDLGAVQVDISQLPTGLYLITATAASGQVYTGRFCKQE